MNMIRQGSEEGKTDNISDLVINRPFPVEPTSRLRYILAFLVLQAHLVSGVLGRVQLRSQKLAKIHCHMPAMSKSGSCQLCGL